MYVVATAGHVDHGKSTLVRRLTGMEPDRWAEERRRGLTIDLGFAWTTLADGSELAFVDVPGHERFVAHMLAGIGPVPAVMFVVAADEGWQPQSAEHLAALDALAVRHGLLVVTRADLADPEPARVEALEHLASTSLGEVPSVVVSGRTGDGLDDLARAMGDLTRRLPAPALDADVRLWIDRSFSVSGAGTVVTGTLTAGTLRTGDELELRPSGEDGRDNLLVRVRGLQTLGIDRPEVPGVARVAVNLRGVERAVARRGSALLSPGAWLSTSTVDVGVVGGVAGGIGGGVGDEGGDIGRLRAGAVVLHVGSAAVPARVRPLGAGAPTVRLSLARPLPLRVGDRGLLRDPGTEAGGHRVVAGVVVLDVQPPDLRLRGAARARAGQLGAVWAGADGGAGGEVTPVVARDLAALLVRHRGVVRGADLRAMGLPVAGLPVARPPVAGLLVARPPVAGPPVPGPPVVGAPTAGDWYVDADHWAAILRRTPDELARWERAHPVAAGMPSEVLRQNLGLPPSLLGPAVSASGLVVRDGLVHRPGAELVLPDDVEKSVRAVEEDLAAAPFVAPAADRLAALALGHREVAAAVRAGRLVKVTDGIVLLPDAVERAAAILASLPQPFTLSAAKTALETTRRVAVPLLELLDRNGITERLPDSTRRLR